MYLTEILFHFFYQIMFQVKQEARAIKVRAAGRRTIPGQHLWNRQTRHPVVRQSQVAVFLAGPNRAKEIRNNP